MKTKLLLFLLLLSSVSGFAQYTSIPDANFEKKLIALGIDDVADGQVLTSKIATVTSLSVYTSSVTDLTGIQDFVALEKLDCGQNRLTNLDLSKNLNLIFLDCFNNSLTNLDLTSNTLLKYLNCSYNNLNFLDVSKNIDLLELNVRQRTLSSLDVTKNTVLKKLQCSYSNLSSLDVSKNTALEFLDCDDNKLSALDVKANTLLINLDCSNNQLTMLDVSNNPFLVTLNCSLNWLTSLNINNGLNANLLASKGAGFTQIYGGQAGIDYFTSFKNNVNLNCIQVDDVEYSNTNWIAYKDITTYFSPIDCASVINVPDSNFEDKLIALNIDTDGKNGIVFRSSINAVTGLDVSNSMIADLTGIQGFSALTTLDASTNLFKKIDLSKNGSLTSLNVTNNSALTCIKVGDIAVAENWATNKDDKASFSLDCEVYTLIPDSKFEEKLIALRIDKDGLNGKVKTESISEVTNLNLIESSISDLTGIEGFTSLKKLVVVGNNLTTADFSKNLELNNLNIARNQLTTLNISKNVALTDLNILSNQLKTLDVSNNIALTSLNFRYNTIVTLDLTKNTELGTLYADENKLTNLDLSQNTKLSDLSLPSNALVSLDVTKNTELKTLLCPNNQINTLDLSKNTKLIQVVATNNNLLNMNIKNGFNSTMTSVNSLKLDQNPNLECIEVDDVAFSNSNWTAAKDATAVFSSDSCPIHSTSYTLIPDTNFEAKLIALGIDDIADGKVFTYKINTLTSLDVSNRLIADLTGIQDFVALTTLNCYKNTISTLDISKNTSLTNLNVGENNLSSLNITNNTTLTSLDCSSNKIIDLDLTNNQGLTSLNVYSNKLTTLNVSKNTILKALECGSNQISALDITLNTKLNYIGCNSNNLADMNLKTNTLLEYLDCADNNLKELDLTKNSALKAIICYRNSFKSLDLSKQTELEGIICSSNKLLTSLNLKNGNNSKLLNEFTFLRGNSGSGQNTSFKNNTILTCILVDDVTFSDTNWSSYKDTTVGYNVDCTSYTLIPDANFEDKLIALGIDTDGKNGKVATESIATITYLDINGSNITDLTGIQDFAALESLSCYNNTLVSLDLSKNLKLITLEAMSSGLTSLEVSNNVALENLYCYSNELTTLDVSKNPNLKVLDCHFNNLTTLNLKNGNNTKFTTLDVSSKVSLPCILVDDEVYSNTNWSNYKDLKSTYSNDCGAYTAIPDWNFEQKLIDLGIDNDGHNGKVLTSNITSIKDLNVQINEIKDLTGIEGFTALETLNCQFNSLTTLDLSKNLNLIELYTHGNLLTTLNLSANTELTTLMCNKNNIETLDFSKNTKLISVAVQENNLKTLNLRNGNNTNFTTAFMFKNPDLKCIIVDNPTFASASDVFFKDEAASYSDSECLIIAYTLIPDANFEQQLINLGIDTDGKNGKVATQSIATVKTLDINRSNITDLTGIQDFTALESLSCYNNDLVSLDLSKNLKLVTLEAMSSGLTSLDVSKNIALENLYCYSNELTTLDVSKNPNLKVLDCHFNNLTTLNLKNGNNTKFTSLDLSSKVNLPCILVDDEVYSNANWSNYKDLKSKFSNDCVAYTAIPDVNFEQKLIDLGIDLDGKNGKVLTSSIAIIKNLNVQISEIKDLTGIEGFTSLETLDCQYNFLTTLDISKNLNLKELYCHGSLLTSLDVSKNTELTTLMCNKNNIETLDFSKNTKLVSIEVQENNLKTLNLKNGNNTNFTMAFMFKNPDLKCINVDNPSFATASDLFFKDATATYSLECTSLGIEDSVFSKITMYPNPTKGEVTISNVALDKASVYNSVGQLVRTFTLDSANTDNTINLSGLAKGVYYVYLINQDAASVKKIIVE